MLIYLKEWNLLVKLLIKKIIRVFICIYTVKMLIEDNKWRN